jgi:hypothetical protein
VQPDGKAEGTARADHSEALATTLADCGRHTRSASVQASTRMDADPAALFFRIARGHRHVALSSHHLRE